MNHSQHFDVIVIGAGPGGEGAAMQAAKRGKSVAVVERIKKVGGGCTHWGTIPSKALRHQIRRVLEVKRNPLFRDALLTTEITFPKLLRSAEGVIDQQVDLRRNFYERNRVPIFFGDAAFIEDHALAVAHDNGGMMRLEADKFVIAVGSRPFRPPGIDFSHPRIFDSDTILSLDRTPMNITIFGAGVIGCEYACIFTNMGVKVNLVNTRDQLLSFLDDEIIHALSYFLRDQGVTIRHNEEFDQVETADDGVILDLKSGKRIKSDVLLWAAGRTGNLDTLGLDVLGLESNRRGNIVVNENYQTAKPHVYAVGDVVGFPSLAAAAYDQGRFAGMHLTDGACDHRLVENMPVGIYTSPEISCIGRNERELTADRIPYEVGLAHFRSLARAQITGERTGMLKILFHRETLEILGLHCFGSQASEIIHIGQAIMSQPAPHNSVEYFCNTTFNYPTMAEAYRVAALNGLNRVF